MKILVVEDDLMLREFLIGEVSDFSHLVKMDVRSASSIEQATQVLGKWVPDIMLLDLSLPDGSGVRVAELYARENPEGKILVLTGQIDFHRISGGPFTKMLYGILNKSEGLEPLRKSLWGLLSSTGGNLPDLSKLSERQMEMLKLIGDGLDTAEIAKIMGITFATAQTHRRQITGRLEIKGSRLFALAQTIRRDAATY